MEDSVRAGNGRAHRERVGHIREDDLDGTAGRGVDVGERPDIGATVVPDDRPDRGTGLDETLDEMGADEAAGTGHRDSPAGPVAVVDRGEAGARVGLSHGP
jgi:hypothetical protein